MKLKLDLFEYQKLVESAWADKTILKASMLQKVIGEWFGEVPKQWLKPCYDFWVRTQEAETENQKRVLARYNPDNQYMITIKGKVKNKYYVMYLYEGKYYKDVSSWIPEENIDRIEKINYENI